jgi:hypothetical protein
LARWSACCSAASRRTSSLMPIAASKSSVSIDRHRPRSDSGA